MTKPNGGWKHDKRSRHERGYGAAWDKLRRRVLIRDKHLCQPCLRVQRVTPATEVHHIQAKADGGSDDPENLVSICHPCHLEAGREQFGKKRTKYDDQGFPIWE